MIGGAFHLLSTFNDNDIRPYQLLQDSDILVEGSLIFPNLPELVRRIAVSARLKIFPKTRN
jgi:hypothetical protein